MQKFAVIGDPVEHSLSPALHNWVFNQLHVDAHYDKINVNSDQLPEVFAAMRDGVWQGLNVTIPHKMSILPLVDELSQSAQAIGAVNCVQQKDGKLIGHNTDYNGFGQLLDRNGIDCTGKTVLVLGAGGAARSVLFSLFRNCPARIVVAARSPNKADRLVQWACEFSAFPEITRIELSLAGEVAGQANVIINCTPLGMAQYSPDNPLEHEWHTGQVLVDTIYTPQETEFLKAGRKSGAKTVNGLDMFIYQALESQVLWLGDDLAGRIPVQEAKNFLIDRLSNVT